VAVGADNITLGDFRVQLFPRKARLACGDGQVETLLFPWTVIKVHDVVAIAPSAIRTGNVLGLTNPATIAFDPLILKSKVVRLMPLIILALIGAVASATPVLRLTVRSRPKLRQR